MAKHKPTRPSMAKRKKLTDRDVLRLTLRDLLKAIRLNPAWSHQEAHEEYVVLDRSIHRIERQLEEGK